MDMQELRDELRRFVKPEVVLWCFFQGINEGLATVLPDRTFVVHAPISDFVELAPEEYRL
jgi:hypothetical protein